MFYIRQVRNLLSISWKGDRSSCQLKVHLLSITSDDIPVRYFTYNLEVWLLAENQRMVSSGMASGSEGGCALQVWGWSVGDGTLSKGNFVRSPCRAASEGSCHQGLKPRALATHRQPVMLFAYLPSYLLAPRTLLLRPWPQVFFRLLYWGLFRWRKGRNLRPFSHSGPPPHSFIHAPFHCSLSGTGQGHFFP